MYLIRPTDCQANGFAELSFRKPEDWLSPGGEGFGGLAIAAALVGDETTGGWVGLTALKPGLASDSGDAHAHGSDNFRISLRGSFNMGRTEYGPGEFRFQEGWKPYPSDNNSNGPDGGWEIVMMGDRRGTRARPVNEASFMNSELFQQMGEMVAQLFELGGDLIDPANTCGTAALVTTLGPTDPSGKLNGSFADRTSWSQLSYATAAAITLLGHPESGPVVILSATEPNAVATPACTLQTELFRLVINGECTIGDRTYVAGDIRVQGAGHRCDAAIAGPHGVQEVLVLGDRRHALADTDDVVWADTLDGLVTDLMSELSSRAA